jgi:hypothetical protein
MTTPPPSQNDSESSLNEFPRPQYIERELFDPEKFFSAIAVVAKEGLWNSPVLDENSLEASLRHLEDDIDHTSMVETGTRPTIVTQQASTTTMSKSSKSNNRKRKRFSFVHRKILADFSLFLLHDG